VRSDGPTVEDIVREEMRPLLKSWLDANLPPLVERLVRVEIERVVGRVVP
jgi:cell pole-organizing protein PopZ